MISFKIPGKPKVQKQTRSCRGRFYDPSHDDRLFIQEIAKLHKPEKIIDEAVEMSLYFYVSPPKSVSKAKREQMLNHVILPTTRPDVDNYGYLVTNALKSIVYTDDSFVTDLHLYKRYSDSPHTLVNINTMKNEN